MKRTPGPTYLLVFGILSLAISARADTRDVTFGMRAAFHGAFSKQEYLIDQLAALNPSSDLDKSGGMLVGFFASYKRLHAEFEVYIDSQLAQVTDPDSVFVEVEPGNGTIGGWLRYAVYEAEYGSPDAGRFPRNRVAFMPGVSVAYTSASVDGWPADDFGPPRSLLEASGTTFAVGVLVEWLFFKGLGVSFDYRYRFAKLSDAVPENEGIQMFDGSPEFDYSGHMFNFAMLYRASLSLFGGAPDEQPTK